MTARRPWSVCPMTLLKPRLLASADILDTNHLQPLPEQRLGILARHGQLICDEGRILRMPAANLLLERRDDLVVVPLSQLSAHLRFFSTRVTGSPQWMHTRTLRPSAACSCLMRVGREHDGQTTMTLLMLSGIAMSRMPPCWTRG